MNIREKINQNPVVAGVITVVLMVVAGWFLVKHVYHPTPSSGEPAQCYFTDDDGKTWFIDDASHIAPFDHNGKDAVRAYLYRCGGGKAFVARLEKFTPAMKQAIDSRIERGTRVSVALYQAIGPGLLMKKPGDKDWVEMKQGEQDTIRKVREIRCPDGSSGDIEPVTVQENAQP